MKVKRTFQQIWSHFFTVIAWMKNWIAMRSSLHQLNSNRDEFDFVGNTHTEAQLYTAISRKVFAKTVHATIPKGNMGYDQYTCCWHCSCRSYFCCVPLALANIYPWPLVPFFEICLKNSVLKTAHNTFRDCRVPFFRQPFSKQLYMSWNVHFR